MYKDNTEISRVEGLIPEQLISDSAPLIEFLKEYYKYLNQDDNPSAVINSMMANRDLDFAVDRFIDLIRKEIGEGIVKNVVANKINLYKHVTDFYQAKGSLDAFKLLFRFLFNIDIEISLPKEQILIASDGRWSQQNSIFINVTEGEAFDLSGKTLTITTGGSNIVVEVDRVKKLGQTNNYEMIITKKTQSAIIPAGTEVTLNGVEFTIIDSLNTASLVYGGSEFEVGQIININNGSVDGTKVKVGSVDSNGAIVRLDLLQFGVGYSANFTARLVPQSQLSAVDPEYNNGPLQTLTGDGSDFFKKELTVNGVRLVAAGAVGGQSAVPDEFIKKVARMYELFTDPLATGINVATQRQFIKDLSGDAGDSYHAGFPTLQRIARGAGSDYTPNFLTDQGIIDWNLTALFDSHVANDMVWYLNSTGSGYGDGDIDAQEVIEHVFHTLHMHGLPAFDLKMYPEFSSDWQTGDLFAAIEEAYDAGVFDPSGYVPATWKTDPDAFPVIAKEYLYLLNFCMFEYSELWEGGSLAPEWSDSMRTQAGILANNPLGYALFNTYIAPVISKPSLATIRNIFQDGDVGDPTIAGLSGYVVDSGSDVDLVISTDPVADKVTYPTHAIFNFSNSTLSQYAGRYITNKGFLSDDIYLQDNFFYQQYSYVIKSGQRFESYENVVKKSIHPAGMLMFGEFEINNEFDLARAITALNRFYYDRFYDEVQTSDNEAELELRKPINEDVPAVEQYDWVLTKPINENIPVTQFYAAEFRKPFDESLTASESTVFSVDKPLSENINSIDSGNVQLNPYAIAYFAEDYTEGTTIFT